MDLNISGSKRLSGACEGSPFFPPTSLCESGTGIRIKTTCVVANGEGVGGCRRMAEGQRKKPQVRTTSRTEVIAIRKFGRNWAVPQRPRNNFRPKLQQPISRVLDVAETRSLARRTGLSKGFLMELLKGIFGSTLNLILRKNR